MARSKTRTMRMKKWAEACHYVTDPEKPLGCAGHYLAVERDTTNVMATTSDGELIAPSCRVPSGRNVKDCKR